MNILEQSKRRIGVGNREKGIYGFAKQGDAWLSRDMGG
jgi:hypothetical protein